MIIERPSSYADTGTDVYALLRRIERYDPDMFATGVDPTNWHAAATYVDRWINREDITQRKIGKEFDCGAMTISRLSSKILGHDEVLRFYGEGIELGGSLGALLRERRASATSVGVATGESEKAVRRRLSSLERYDEMHELKCRQVGGVDYFWTNPIEKV